MRCSKECHHNSKRSGCMGGVNGTPVDAPALTGEFYSWGNYTPSQKGFTPLPEYLIRHPEYSGSIDYSHHPMPECMVLALIECSEKEMAVAVQRMKELVA